MDLFRNAWPNVECIWSESDGDSCDWSETAVVFYNGSFYVLSDSGCSCNGPWENLDRDESSLLDELILSPAWEGWKDEFTKKELLEALRDHPNRPDWIGEVE